MARAARQFVCQSCGGVSAKWAGRCDACGAWNAIVEEAPRGRRARGAGVEFLPISAAEPVSSRLASGLDEFDRVVGGGLVSGSGLLLAGDPGIGKSTLLLQVASRFAGAAPAVYISGEEMTDQIRLRATRLGLADGTLKLAAETSLNDVAAALDRPDGPRLAIVDSIQTMYLEGLDSAAGTVAQVRACAQELLRLAKRRGFCVILVGHVTKEGAIAGPRVLEHMVDAVLYFEGERSHQFRLLRGIKNRFGPTDEIGVFEMTDRGLIEVANPSALFLAERRCDVSGATVFAGIEGTRPMLVEIQALVAPSVLTMPRRAVVGWDSARLAMILAVLEARCGIALGGRDVYLNVAGGMRIGEPAADLAVAGALLSAATGGPAPKDAVIFGEIGLGGEVRSVSQPGLRLREAAKLGFARAIAPPLPGGETSASALTEIAHLKELADMFPWQTAASAKE